MTAPVFDDVGARERLVAATRALTQAVGTTDAHEDELVVAAERLLELVPVLSTRTVPTVPAPSFDESVGAGSYRAAAFNPALAAVDMTFRDGRALACVTLDSVYEGPRGCVHGGVISYLMDTLLASLVQHEGHLCVTASLTVDYRGLTPLHQPLELDAAIAGIDGRKVLATGTIGAGGRVTAEATAVFVTVSAR